MLIEIGGGTKPLNYYENFDPMREGEWGGRLGYDRIPVDDETSIGVYASHVLEHIPQGQPRVDAMNEVWRVLKPGASFEFLVPIIGHTDTLDGSYVWTRDWRPWADPTHVSQWWFPESVLYFCEGNEITADADYGIKLWQPLRPQDWEVRDGWEGRALLRKPV